MKELKMFPQITEETEENLLNLENDSKIPYSISPPLDSTSDSPTPSSPNNESHLACPQVTVTPEDCDPSTDIPVTKASLEEECATPPTRVRVRSLSGGAYRLAPTLPAAGRMRRQSGDDVLTRVSPSRRAALFEHFRPRSKSDSKGKRPTFLSNLKNSIFSPQRKTSLEVEPPPLEPLQPGGDYRQRPRSGSETRGGTMSKMIDLFRNRSNSLSADSKSKKPLSSLVPTNALLRRHSVDPDKRRRPFNTYRSLEAHQVDTCHTDEDAKTEDDDVRIRKEEYNFEEPLDKSKTSTEDSVSKSCEESFLSLAEKQSTEFVEPTSDKEISDSSIGGKSFLLFPDVSLTDSSEQTANSEILGATGDESSGDKNTSAEQKEKFFKWLPKSPKRFFSNVSKGLKSPSKSSKKTQIRPLCSSEIQSDVTNWTFHQLSPIRKQEDLPKESTKKSHIPPMCSSDVQGDVGIWTFHQMSPVHKQETLKEEKSNVDLPVHLKKTVVDRIDFTSLAEEKVIPTFLSSRTCYDVMPTSGKVVVLSVELLVKNAFEALVSNELRAAPLWDFSSFSFVGMLTISDFINVLRYYYCNAQDDIKDIESQSIATWRRINKISKPFIKVNGMDNLAQATKLLIEEGVHRIPVFDEGRQCVLFVLTRKRLLHYLYYNIIEKFGKTVASPSFLSKSISELEVGTFGDIAKVTNTTKVIEALDLFTQRKVSALPIVDENNILIDIFGKFDVFALAKEQTYHNLDMTISEAIDKGKVHEDVYGCTLEDTLGTVIHTFVTTKAHRLVVIDEKKSVVGMVSLSDILRFLVVQPLGTNSCLGAVLGDQLLKAKMEDCGTSPADTIDETPEGAVSESEKDDSVFLDPKEKSGDTNAKKSSVSNIEETTDSKDTEKDGNETDERSIQEDTPKNTKLEE